MPGGVQTNLLLVSVSSIEFLRPGSLVYQGVYLIKLNDG